MKKFKIGDKVQFLKKYAKLQHPVLRGVGIVKAYEVYADNTHDYMIVYYGDGIHCLIATEEHSKMFKRVKNEKI